MINLVLIEIERVVRESKLGCFDAVELVPFEMRRYDRNVNSGPYVEMDYIYNVCNMALSGYSKIWVNPENGFIIAYEDVQGYGFSPKFTQYLIDMKPLEVVSVEKKDVVDIDSILDKISKYGNSFGEKLLR